MNDIPKTREETTELLKSKGWKLIHSESYMSSSFEIWTHKGYSYQLRLSWPRDDFDGYTTTEIEITKAVKMINDCDWLMHYLESEGEGIANE